MPADRNGGRDVGKGVRMIHQIAVSGYRSLRDLTVMLGELTIITGPNGSGKSSFYRALRLCKALGETLAEQRDEPDRWVWPRRG
jgi:AAA15 family ATPase/GTPase